MLSQLVYVSSAVKPFTSTALSALLEASRCKNAKRGATGLLLHIGGNFMQALEGEEQAVEALYRTIAQDDRHRFVTVLMRTPIEQRLFPDWTMGFKETTELSADRQTEISSFLDDVRAGGTMADAAPLARSLLRNFALTMR